MGLEGGNGLLLVEEKKRANPNDAVIQIAVTEEDHITKQTSGPQSSSIIEITELDEDHSYRNQLSIGSASPDKPAETNPFQSLTRRKLTVRSVDLQYESDHHDAKLVEGNDNDKEFMLLPSNTPTMMSSPDKEEKKKEKKKKESNKIKKIFVVIELIAFVCVMGLLISSLTVTKLKNHLVWEIELWKWCLFVSVIFCGRLVTKWFMIALIFLIEKNFRLKLMVLYYVDGLRGSARVFIWMSLVLLSWSLLVERSKESNKKIINYITRGLVACLVGIVLWMVKTLSFKLLVASRLSRRFFDQIQQAWFNEYVFRTCVGPPLMEMTGSFRMKEKEKEKEKEEVINAGGGGGGKRQKMKKISAWTMEKLINHITSSKLSTWDEDYESEREIESEMEAIAAAYHIFRNVARPGSKYIDDEDLLRFLPKVEVDIIMPDLVDVETGRISRSVVKNWVVNIYKERKSLAHYLNNSKEAMEELNKLFTGIVMVLIFIVWLIIVGLLTTKALLLILSQLLLAVFLFGNTAKNVFEAIIFLFLTHPFDVGDRCVIDGAQMVVEEMHILTTTFLRYDNEKIFYPNSVLATKPISNFYRSTVDLRDAVEFAIDVSSPIEKIGFLKSKIRKYLENNPRHWSPDHSVVVKQIKDEKLIMGLFVTHIIIFENYEEKINRRSELVLELKRIFDEAGIRIYHVLPQEVLVSYVGSTTSAVPPPEN